MTDIVDDADAVALSVLAGGFKAGESGGGEQDGKGDREFNGDVTGQRARIGGFGTKGFRDSAVVFDGDAN